MTSVQATVVFIWLLTTFLFLPGFRATLRRGRPSRVSAQILVWVGFTIYCIAGYDGILIDGIPTPNPALAGIGKVLGGICLVVVLVIAWRHANNPSPED